MDETAYPAHTLQRWVPEPDKRPGRTAFQRDRARVQHSAALRRLAGKTQVVSPGESDFPRTRLTHSLECAQIGRDLGAALGCDQDLVEAACLAHDLGHPPFGHNGEQVLAEFARDIGGFEGNAQSLRLLTRLEPKRFSADGSRSVGLNLTRAALDAATKYPWPRGGHPTEPASPKFGVYQDDLEVFRWMRAGAPEARRCFEAEVMDWSDDVAYSVHDLEDGVHAGHIHPEALHAPAERAELFAIAAARYAPGAEPAELAEALDRLQATDYWPAAGYDASPRAQARLKDATSQLIGRFCLAAEQATRAAAAAGPAEPGPPPARHRAALRVPRATRLECAVLKSVAELFVMRRDEQARRRSRQRVVIGELTEALLDGAPRGLEPLFGELFESAGDDAARRRVLVDQVASLTDASALALHRRLVSPPG